MVAACIHVFCYSQNYIIMNCFNKNITLCLPTDKYSIKVYNMKVVFSYIFNQTRTYSSFSYLNITFNVIRWSRNSIKWMNWKVMNIIDSIPYQTCNRKCHDIFFKILKILFFKSLKWMGSHIINVYRIL